MGPCSCPRTALAGRPGGCLAPRARSHTPGGHRAVSRAGLGGRAGDTSGPGAAHASLIPASTSPVPLIALPHDKIPLNP